MSTSFVYHAMGLSGYEHVHQKFEEGSAIFRVRPKSRLLCCSVYKLKQVVQRSLYLRKLHSLPMGHKPIWLVVEVPRVWCVRRIRLGIAEPKRSYTRAFARYVLDLSKLMILKDVALFLGVGWDCMKDIVKRNLERRFSRSELKHVRYLAIDEISVRKGHKYVTLVMDLDSGAVLFVGDGEGAEVLEPFS